MAHDPFRASEALRRATDILKEGTTYTDKITALRTLHEPLGGRRKVNFWHPVMEKIIIMHLDLCIELAMLDLARKALEQYKKITQNVNAASLQDVIASFVAKLDVKLSSGAAAQPVTLQLEELLRAQGFASDEFRDKIDRCKQLPQAKFTWDAHRFSLEILKVNPKLTTLFLNTIQKSALFCVAYKRKGDLKDLLKLTKKHLDRVPKVVAKEADMRKFYYSTPDLFHCYLDTWFKLFEVASGPDMGMWQEAYRTVEQVNSTISEAFFGMTPKPSHTVMYFEALAKVFWAATVGPNSLYHAYALFLLWKRKKRQGTDAEQTLAGQVVLACLCIPFTDNSNVDGGSVAERSVENPFALLTQWTQLLGLRYTPTRETLLRDVLKAVVPTCDAIVKSLYDVVHRSATSLALLHEATDVLDSVSANPSYAAYASVIRKNIVTVVVNTAFHSYSAVRMTTLVTLCHEGSFAALEGTVLAVAASRKETAYIDQENGTVRFSRRDADAFAATLSNVRNVVSSIRSDFVIKRSAKTKEDLVKAAIAGAQGERQQLMVRLELMEKRRVTQDIDRDEKRKKEFQDKLQRDTQQRQEAERVLLEERLLREKKKKEDDETAKELQRGKDLLEKIKVITGKDHGDLQKIDDKKKLIDGISQRLAEEQRMLEDKAREEVKRLDFFVRAMREQEAPALQSWWVDVSTEMEKDAKARQTNQLEMHRKNFDSALENKKRLMQMDTTRKAFQNSLVEKRKAAFAEFAKKRTAEQRGAEAMAAGAAKPDGPSLRDQMRPTEVVPEPTAVQAAPAATGKWQPKGGAAAARPPPAEDSAPSPAPTPVVTSPEATTPAAAGPAKWAPKGKVAANPPPEETAPPPAAAVAPPAAAETPARAPGAGAWKPKAKR